jgi:hypothetical protein
MSGTGRVPGCRTGQTASGPSMGRQCSYHGCDRVSASGLCQSGLEEPARPRFPAGSGWHIHNLQSAGRRTGHYPAQHEASGIVTGYYIDSASIAHASSAHHKGDIVDLVASATRAGGSRQASLVCASSNHATSPAPSCTSVAGTCLSETMQLPLRVSVLGRKAISAACAA